MWYRIINRVFFSYLTLAVVGWFFTSDPANPKSAGVLENPYFASGLHLSGILWGFTNAICWRRYQADVRERLGRFSQQWKPFPPWLEITNFLVVALVSASCLMFRLLTKLGILEKHLS